MRDRLRHDLTAAMKAHDQVAVATLRSTIAAIENAEAVEPRMTPAHPVSSEHVAGATAGVGSSEVERLVLTDADEIAIIERQRQERLRAASEYERLGHNEPAERLRLEAAVLARYLPADA